MRLIQSMIMLLFLSHTAPLPEMSPVCPSVLDQNGASDVRLMSLLEFRKMIICSQSDSWPLLDYADYGCYCGKGGSGTPVDDLDKCCEVHDRCYGDAMKHKDCVPFWDNPYTEVYSYRCDETKKTFTCLNNNNPCEKFICECDRNAAMCFANSEYNEENKHLPSERCT